MDFAAERLADAVDRFACTPTTASKLMSRSAIEMVVVATPNAAHCANVVEALTAGKHVVWRKALCTTLDEATK